jgi:hypothetical protein
MVRYVSESHLDKIFDLFFAERNNEIRSILGESLFILSLQLNMRRYWLQSPRYDQLTEAVFQQGDFSEICAKILAHICSLTSARVYIPGESHIVS